MTLWDFHAHPDFYGEEELPGVLAGLETEDVRLVAASVDPESWSRNRALAARSDRIVPSFGVHPERAAAWAGRLEELETPFSESRLIGEIGLDRLWVPAETYTAQRDVFRWFVERCAETGKWSVLHTKDAEEEVLEVLAASRAGGAPYGRAVVHWYSGPDVLVPRFLDLGCMFSFGVEVRRSARLRAILRRIPEDRLLLETDNPVGEEWLGGVRGGPALVGRVLDDLASTLGRDREALGATSTANALRILRETGAVAF